MKLGPLSMIYPSQDATNIPLNAMIKLSFEELPINLNWGISLEKVVKLSCKTLATPLHQFPPIDPNSLDECEGKITFDSVTKMVTFWPTSLLATNWIYFVQVDLSYASFSKEKNSAYSKVFEWSFQTEGPQNPLRLRIQRTELQTSSQEKQSIRLITISRTHGSYLSGL